MSVSLMNAPLNRTCQLHHVCSANRTRPPTVIRGVERELIREAERNVRRKDLLRQRVGTVRRLETPVRSRQSDGQLGYRVGNHTG